MEGTEAYTKEMRYQGTPKESRTHVMKQYHQSWISNRNTCGGNVACKANYDKESNRKIGARWSIAISMLGLLLGILGLGIKDKLISAVVGALSLVLGFLAIIIYLKSPIPVGFSPTTAWAVMGANIGISVGSILYSYFFV
jgi:predicted lipid-binding transport protein (Tim44 family)